MNGIKLISRTLTPSDLVIVSNVKSVLIPSLDCCDVVVMVAVVLTCALP